MEYLLQILVALVLLYVLARIGSIVVSRFGLPGLIGEILIGIVIANLAFGDWSLMDALGISLPTPGTEETGSDVYHVIYALAELGVIFLLFSVGLETKVNDLLKSGKPALLCAIMGVIIPFILGFAVIMAYDGNMNHALFMAAAMVATSVGITARIIKDMKLMDTREARIIIAAAVIDDVLGMIVLAIVKGMAESGELSIGSILSITLQAVVFVLAVIAFCKWCVPRIYDYFEARRKAKEAEGKVPISINKLALAIIVCLGMAALAEYIGLAAIIGAFLAGMIFAEHAWEWDLEHKIDSISTFMLSFFFLNVGMQVDLGTLGNTTTILLIVVILVLAILSKYIGCSLGAKMGDRTLDRSSLNIIGFGMAPRGEVGIIVASIGLASGAMSTELYAIVVFMSVLTTIIAPPIVSRLFKKKYAEEYTILPDDRF
ncbi:MAG: cation:proton antiporter [Thermoplasmata archaeon]|nr:cation:proton antiporter [Thermoplasmata archaeon]